MPASEQSPPRHLSAVPEMPDANAARACRTPGGTGARESHLRVPDVQGVGDRGGQTANESQRDKLTGFTSDGQRASSAQIPCQAVGAKLEGRLPIAV
jgi:hypothetical protein